MADGAAGFGDSSARIPVREITESARKKKIGFIGVLVRITVDPLLIVPHSVRSGRFIAVVIVVVCGGAERCIGARFSERHWRWQTPARCSPPCAGGDGTRRPK